MQGLAGESGRCGPGLPQPAPLVVVDQPSHPNYMAHELASGDGKLIALPRRLPLNHPDRLPQKPLRLLVAGPFRRLHQLA